MSNGPMENLFSSRSMRLAIGICTAALLLTTLSLVLYEGTKKSVTLTLNGKETEIKTHAHTVETLLADEQIEVGKNDVVEPSVNTPIENGLAIRWEQAQQVAIDVDGTTKKVWTTGKSVREALAEAGIEVAKHDKVSPSLNASLPKDQEITVEKAFQVTLNDGGNKKKVWSTSTTVADFLKDQNVRLNGLDKIEGDPKQRLDSGSVVKVIRVEKVTDVVEEPANFEVETRKDPKLLEGREKVVREGKKGKVERTFEIVKRNGKEVSRQLVSEQVIEQPKNKVVHVGTKVMVASANTKNKGNVGVSRSDSGAPSGGREFYATATAYTAYCNGCSGTTATGINLRANPNLKVIAVDPRVIPLGSKVWVEGYGYAVAGDTGGAIKGNRIDLHMPTKSAAYQFGRRQVKVKVIN